MNLTKGRAVRTARSRRRFIGEVAGACAGAALFPSLLEGAEPAKTLKVFLLAGQSNMAGADSVILQPGFQLTEADRESLFTGAPAMDGAKAREYCPWGPLQGHRSFNERYGEKQVHGPEVGFVRGLYAAGWRNIAVIKVWANFKRDVMSWPWAEGGDLHRRWCAFADARLEELKQQGKAYRVAGFGWHQGIDDAIHGKLAAAYQQNLTALIGAMRTRYAEKATPFILARSVNSPIARNITGHGENDPMAVVRRAQVTVAETVPHCGWVNVDDLPNVVQHHFTSASQLVIGQRFAEKFLRVVKRVK